MRPEKGTTTELSRWTSIGMASDSMDVVASLASRRAIGSAESVGAALAALAFTVGDASVLRSIRGGVPTLQDESSTADSGDHHIGVV